MRRAAAGDTEAFAVIVQRHRPWVQRLLQRLCWDEQEAEDGAQETFVRLWLARERYRDGSLRHYLYRIARNWWLNRLRAARSRPRTVPLEQQLGLAGRELLGRMLEESGPADVEVLRRQEGQRARRAIARLEEPLRMVFLLAHLEGLPYPQVAEVLGLPVGTVKSRMYRAVRLLRTELQAGEEAEGDEM